MKHNKVLLEKFELNYQKAENFAKFEMISPELAALHYFCKLANVDFVDINQKDLCKINDTLTVIKRFTQTNEIDLFIEDLNEKYKNIKNFIFYVIEHGKIIFLGLADDEFVNKKETFFHFKAEKECKKIMYDELFNLNKLLKIYAEKEKKEVTPKQQYVPLHVHTQYSIGDGVPTAEQIAKNLKEKNFNACAITDHGTLQGTIYFQKALLEQGIKPILGIEAYVIPTDNFKDKSYHLILLAKNKIGWKNLLKLQEKAVRDNFYYKPKFLLSDILKYHEGLICTSACISGLIGRNILNNNLTDAENFIKLLKQTFKEDFYLELMPNRLREQKIVNKKLIEFSKKYNIKTIITTDSHYCEHKDEKIHKAIKAISLRKKYNESGFSDDTFYLLKDSEIKQLINKHHSYITDNQINEMFMNTFEISNKCNFKLEFKKEDTLPKLYNNPKEKLKQFVMERLEKNTGYKYYEVKDRIDLELNRFLEKHYANYFLVVDDYVRFCKNNNIMVGPGRGSVGGSLVAYALGITTVDPLQYNLLFDRFCSVIRKDMPDIDLDFEDSKRHLVFKYLKEKYSERNVSKIITFSTWHAKGALRDIGRIFEIPIGEVEKITRLVVTRRGGDARANFCLLDTFTEFEQAKKFYKKYKEACDIAIALEGHIRHRGVHAAGITVTENPIAEYVPIEKVNGEIVTAWEKKEIESMGLIKFDILGLKTLSTISKTLEFIKKYKNIEIQLPKKFDDKQVFKKIFQSGNTLGVFQFETSGLGKLAKQLQIDNFKMLYDATTLYRPGPLHSGETADYVLRHLNKKKRNYDHALLKPITQDTYGLILYQEQVMQVMYDLGKFSWATAESARKIMTKSQGKEAFNKMRKEFCKNALKEHNIPIEESEKIFNVVSTFGSYGFNKSHAVEYSIISYWTAWLKTHFPAEFFAALLSNEKNADKIANYFSDIQKNNIEIKMPDINISKDDFVIINNKIYSNFISIKGIAEKTSKKIIKNQPYCSVVDFIKKNKPGLKLFKSLVAVGAFDNFGYKIKFLYQNAEKIIKQKSIINTNQKTLLISNTNDADDEEWTEKEKTEKLIQYSNLIPHNLMIKFQNDPFANKIKYEKIGDLIFEEYADERWIKGVVTFINFKQEGLEGQWTMFDNILERRYAHLNVSDGSGNVLVHLSPEQYTYYKHYLEKGTGFAVIIKGHTIPKFNKIYCDAMIVLDDIDNSNPIIDYIHTKREKQIKKLQEKFKNKTIKYGIIKTVTYKISKNKKPYARIKFYGDDNYYLVFSLSKKIFISGEILIYTDKQKPFIQIYKRI